MTEEEEVWPQTLTHENHSETLYQCKYIIKNHSILGDGNFSVVKECMNVSTRDIYAMKLISKKLIRDKLRLIQREFNLLKIINDQIRVLEKQGVNEDVSRAIFLGHHHILQLTDYFETSESIVLITQLCDKGDLYEKIVESQHLDLHNQVQPYCACILSALDFLHSNGIVHRDIKAENVLFRLNKQDPRKPDTLPSTSDESSSYDVRSHDLVLADFGLATTFDVEPGSTTLKEYVGTISYVAPEIVKCKGIGKLSTKEINAIEPYGKGVDLWALGVLTYFMALGYTPFDCETDEETLECISNCDYYMDEETLKDPKYKDFWSFLECCFNPDQSQRESTTQLKKHPFIRHYFPEDETSGTDGQNSTFESRPHLAKSHSTASFHALRIPSRSPSSSSLNILSLSNSGSNHASPSPQINAKGEGMSHYFDAKLKNSSSLTSKPPGFSSKSLVKDNGSKSVSQLRDSLQKTLSMTSLRTPLGPQSTLLDSSMDELRKNSTFVLNPKPQQHNLMNGVLSTTPESKSNFGTPSSLSRNNSANNIFDPEAMNNAKQNAARKPENDSSNLEKTSAAHSFATNRGFEREAKFTMAGADEEEEDEEEYDADSNA